MLITTRNQSVGRKFKAGVVETFAVEALNDDDAKKLLCMSIDGAQGGEQLLV